MNNVKVYGEHDAKTIAQMARCMEIGSAVGGVLCADGHLGYGHPIGGVVAYHEHVSLSGVGFDIGCGNMAAHLDVKTSDLAGRDIKTIAEDIAKAISFGVGRKNTQKVEHELFDEDWSEGGIGHLKGMARDQLGTVGAGNHYVDVFADEAGNIWIGVHFGSRGLGHKTATMYFEHAGAKDGMEVDPAVVSIHSELGQRYIAAMGIAGRYAYAGREWVVDRVRQIIGGNVVDTVHNHHNFAWLEDHGGNAMWVVRKGATPAFPGQRGFVGGSMGDDAVIIEGVDSGASAANFYSTIHGAGRVMSRTDARGRTRSVAQCTTPDCTCQVDYQDYEERRKKAGLKIGARFTLCSDHPDGTMAKKRLRMSGRVRHDEMIDWVTAHGVTLIGGDLDEAPQAYRRLPEVLAHHDGTIRVLHTLRPLIVVMAGKNDVEPYKN